MHVLIQLLLHREKQVNFNLIQRKSCSINYNQYIQNKIKNKICMKAVNYECFKLEEKATASVKKNKRQFY